MVDGMHLTEDQVENSVESNKKIERAAMIPEAIMPHVCSSPRLAKSKDEHTLIRSDERAAKKKSRALRRYASHRSLLFFAFWCCI